MARKALGLWLSWKHISMMPPPSYRARLRTTNAQERLNEELRRRERVIRIFPSRASVIRLLGALLMEMEEQWTTGHCYLAMESYWQWKGRPAPSPTGAGEAA